MQKHFYTHIIEIDTVYTALDELDLEPHEKDELVLFVHTHVHHVVIHTILSELSEEDKKTFLTHLSKNDHEGIWSHLRTKVENVEDKIKHAVENLKKTLHQDIEEIES